jgi:hypothetical protein
MPPAFNDNTDLSAVLLPYGPLARDAVLERNDDGSASLWLTAILPFLDQNYDELWINNNGLISFDGPVHSYSPAAFTAGGAGQPIIAPLWSDVDTRKYVAPKPAGSIQSQTVYYRFVYREPGAAHPVPLSTADAIAFDRVEADMPAVFPGDPAFTPNELVIVTWSDVAQFPAGDVPGNTFQLVLATDSDRTYAFIRYQDISWTGGSANAAGIDAADGFNSVAFPGSGSPAVSGLTSSSNVNMAGLWAYRVDTIIAGGGCSPTSARMSPLTGSQLGGELVTVSGLCINNQVGAKCVFTDGAASVTVDAMPINGVKAMCPVPFASFMDSLSLTFIDGDGTATTLQERFALSQPDNPVLETVLVLRLNDHSSDGGNMGLTGGDSIGLSWNVPPSLARTFAEGDADAMTFCIAVYDVMLQSEYAAAAASQRRLRGGARQAQLTTTPAPPGFAAVYGAVGTATAVWSLTPAADDWVEVLITQPICVPGGAVVDLAQAAARWGGKYTPAFMRPGAIRDVFVRVSAWGPSTATPQHVWNSPLLLAVDGAKGATALSVCHSYLADLANAYSSYSSGLPSTCPATLLTAQLAPMWHQEYACTKTPAGWAQQLLGLGGRYGIVPVGSSYDPLIGQAVCGEHTGRKSTGEQTAATCLRSAPANAVGASAECCYSSSLISTGPGAGRPSRYDPAVDFFRHQRSDVAPFVACCAWSSNATSDCNTYLHQFPSVAPQHIAISTSTSFGEW